MAIHSSLISDFAHMFIGGKPVLAKFKCKFTFGFVTTTNFNYMR